MAEFQPERRSLTLRAAAAAPRGPRAQALLTLPLVGLALLLAPEIVGGSSSQPGEKFILERRNTILEVVS